MTPFHWFLGIFTLLSLGVVYVFRNAFDGIRDVATEHARTYAKPYAIGAALIAIAGMTTFREIFSKLTAAEAAALSWYGWAALFFTPLISMLNTLVAFLNTSKAEADTKREAQIAKESNAPFGKQNDPGLPQ